MGRLPLPEWGTPAVWLGLFHVQLCSGPFIALLLVSVFVQLLAGRITSALAWAGSLTTALAGFALLSVLFVRELRKRRFGWGDILPWGIWVPAGTGMAGGGVWLWLTS